MKFFNKIATFLTVLSFVFSGDVFAARTSDEINNEKKGIKRTLRMKRAHVKKERAPRTRKARRPSAADRKQAVRTRRASINRQARAQLIAEKRRAALQRKVGQKRAATRNARPQKREQTQIRNARKARVKTPRYYTVSPNDIPADLQNDLRKVGTPIEKFKGKATPEEFRAMLSNIQKDENLCRGATQKFRNLYASQGYVPGNPGNFIIEPLALKKCPPHSNVATV